MKKETSEQRKNRLAKMRAYHRSHRAQIKSRGVAYRAAHVDQGRNRVLRHKYGLTLEQFYAILANQRGICASCGTSRWGARGPVVDHDHETGKTRGILCSGCNLAAGQLGDDPGRARLLATYLEKTI